MTGPSEVQRGEVTCSSTALRPPPRKCRSLHLSQGLYCSFSCPTLLPESCAGAGIQLWTASVVSSPSTTLGHPQLVSPTTALSSKRPSSLGKGLPQVWSEPRKACMPTPLPSPRTQAAVPWVATCIKHSTHHLRDDGILTFSETPCSVTSIALFKRD